MWKKARQKIIGSDVTTYIGKHFVNNVSAKGRGRQGSTGSKLGPRGILLVTAKTEKIFFYLKNKGSILSNYSIFTPLFYR